MSLAFSSRFLPPWLIVCGLLWLSGCAPVDRWQPFADLETTHRAKLLEPAINAPDLAVADDSLPVLDQSAMDEGPLEISVEQAALLALRHNRDLQVEQLTPLVVGTFEQIERGRFDPELFAAAEASEERSSEVSRSTREQFEVEARGSEAVIGLRQELPTGTTLEASFGQERTLSNRAPEQQTARLGLSVTQALLRGFGPAVNLVSIRQAELDTLASVHELRGFTEALLANTEIAYWEYILAREEIAIFEESLAVASQQLEEIALRIEVGILPEIEAAAARAEQALRIQNLIDARSLLEERRLRLLRLISPGQESSLDRAVVATSEPRLRPEPINDLDDRLNLAEQARPDLNEARLRLQRNRLETVVTRNGLLPRLELFVALGKTGYADTFSEAFHNLDGQTYDLSAGLRFNHVLGDRAAAGRHTAARISRHQAAAAIANLRQLVRLDVRLAVNEAERARQQIEASRASRRFQEQTLQAEQERFAVGASTSLQVVQAQRDLLRSQIAEIEAVVNYRIALVNLYLAEGSLLQRRGMAVADAGLEPF